MDSGRAVLRRAERLEDLPQAMDRLIDLHQRRWQALGQSGCFASARFTAFHRDVAAALLAEGRLALWWLEVDGQPVAAEYHLTGDGVVYAYQGGIEPARLAVEPGGLILGGLPCAGLFSRGITPTIFFAAMSRTRPTGGPGQGRPRRSASSRTGPGPGSAIRFGRPAAA